MSLAISGVARAGDAPASITVDGGHVLGPVNDRVFGDNVEAGDTKHVFADTTNVYTLRTGNGFWDDARGIPVQPLIDLLRDVKVTMLRYPGGSLANTFDWKKAVGEPSSRGDWHFGIDEYLATCRSLGASPVITVSDYTGTPKDAADLVEYLNAPAEAGHPWAQLRAKLGHAAPYGVKWFELGNESDDGGGYPRRTYSPEEYAAYARETAAAMRAVDPSIKIGVVAATSKPVDDPWNGRVFRSVGPIADFVVVHLYPFGYDSSLTEDVLMRGCMAAGDACERKIKDYHACIVKAVGHDLPLAVTEYNCGFAQDKPVPYRFSLAGALFSADMIRILMKPENNVLMANYWQSVNGYWGMLRGSGNQWTAMPEYSFRRLWGKHFGSNLVAATAVGPSDSVPAISKQRLEPGTLIETRRIDSADIKPNSGQSIAWSTNGDQVDFAISQAAHDLFPEFGRLPIPKALRGQVGWYRFECDIRCDSQQSGTSAGYSLGVVDGRGWTATQSAAKSNSVASDGEWHHVVGNYCSLADTPEIALVLRVEAVSSPLTSVVSIKNVRVTASTVKRVSRILVSDAPYSLLTCAASRSVDGKTLYLVVFNKSSDRDIETDIRLARASVTAARRWTVTGPSLAATNLDGAKVTETESDTPTALLNPSALHHTFPARSMTAFEFALK